MGLYNSEKQEYKAQFVALFGAGYNKMSRAQKHIEWVNAMNLRKAVGRKTWGQSI